MTIGRFLKASMILFYCLSSELHADDIQMACDEDWLPVGMEEYRNYWQSKCSYVSDATATLLSFDYDYENEAWRAKNFPQYIVWGRKLAGGNFEIWTPELFERSYPTSCSKPITVETLAICRRGGFQ